jgi:hypothetical protein
LGAQAKPQDHRVLSIIIATQPAQLHLLSLPLQFSHPQIPSPLLAPIRFLQLLFAGERVELPWLFCYSKESILDQDSFVWKVAYVETRHFELDFE